ncbi:response regulator transcription factor [Vibrio ezurae]|uniref:Putative two-component response regulator n=1 Tax=Vibrio ezurae NBRC 102218 TaxID=1219080 RepID=U3AZU6_9VIBR|nr:response regulator transcription factor [Vibrio ezurae]GAD79250.1 putative two-component response regulator [Vibrio ezurae NBRC 102218]
MDKRTVLIVDDSQEVLDALSEYLEIANFNVLTALHGGQMWQILETVSPDLIILDIMLPGDDGLTLCQKLRRSSQVPIIMLTAVTDDADRIAGLEIGADDYITKSFNPRELLARIKALLRRSSYTSKQTSRYIQFMGWKFDTLKRNLVGTNDEIVVLSGSDFNLLTLMLSSPNKLLTRDDIAQALWGRNAEPLERGIDVQISRLRKQIGDHDRSVIMSLRNQGYMFVSEEMEY